MHLYGGEEVALLHLHYDLEPMGFDGMQCIFVEKPLTPRIC